MGVASMAAMCSGVIAGVCLRGIIIVAGRRSSDNRCISGDGMTGELCRERG